MADITIDPSDPTFGVDPSDPPTGLTAEREFDGVRLSWTLPDQTLTKNRSIDYIEVHRSATNNRSSAVKIAEIKSNGYVDQSNITGTYYYWVRTRNTAGLESTWEPASSTAGVASSVQRVIYFTDTSQRPAFVTQIDTAASINSAVVARKDLQANSIESGDGSALMIQLETNAGGNRQIGRFGATYQNAGTEKNQVELATSNDNGTNWLTHLTASVDEVAVNVPLKLKSYTTAGLPASGNGGQVIVVSDDSYSLRYWTGTQWEEIAGTSGTPTDLDSLTDVAISTPSNGQLLKYNGTAWINSTVTTGINNLVEDTTPQLGGDLDVNAYKLVSTSNGNIELAPNGTGDVYLTADTVRIGDLNANATITTNGTGNLLLTTGSTNSGSITIAQGDNADITVNTHGTGKIILSDTVRTNTIDGNGSPLILYGNLTSGGGQVAVGSGSSALVELFHGASGSVVVGTNTGTEGQLRFLEASGSNYIGFKAPSSITTDTTWTLPSSDGTNKQVLTTNGSGTLSWATVDLIKDEGRVDGQLLASHNASYAIPPSALTTVDGTNGFVVASSSGGDGYGANVSIRYYSGDTTAGTNSSANVLMSGASGTNSSPSAASSGQTLATINADGYATNNFASHLATTNSGSGTTAIFPIQLQFYTRQAFADNGTDVTAAGCAFRIRGFDSGVTMSTANRINFVDHHADTAIYRSDSFTIRQGGSGTTDHLVLTTTNAQFTNPVQFPSYTVTTLPSATTAGRMIYVSNETGGAVMAFSDGTNWRRVTDRAIVA